MVRGIQNCFHLFMFKVQGQNGLFTRNALGSPFIELGRFMVM